jgi:putative ABC transport system permease protein
MTQMPIRNVMRTPRRTVLTAVGVGAAITALVAVLGMLDSFGRTLDQADAEFTKGNADRVVVQLDTFYPSDSPAVDTISDTPAVGRIDAGLRLPATALGPEPDDDIDLLVEFVDMEDAAWTPTIDEGAATVSGDVPGIVLAGKAAADLEARIGDTVTLRHPLRSDTGGFSIAETPLVVTGIHSNPIRTFAFLDITDATHFGLAGVVNVVQAYPADDATRSDVQRAVFGVPGVTSSQPVARISEAIDEALDQFLSFLLVTAGAVLVLALLIAFNATRITVEERRREHATMRAFGLPVRTVLGVVVKESAIVGIIATVIGLVGGVVFLQWMLTSLAATTLPDVGIDVYLSPTTIVIAAVVGIVSVAVTPLFLVRRLRRMDLPGTLRVVE